MHDFVHDWIKSWVNLQNKILLSCKKEGNLTFCDNVDEPGVYYAKCNKQVRERQKPYDSNYIQNLMNK